MATGYVALQAAYLWQHMQKKNNSMSLNEAVNGQNLVFAHSLPHKLSIVNVIKQKAMLLCMKMYDQKTHNNENSHFQV